jgi:hypothetical protein
MVYNVYKVTKGEEDCASGHGAAAAATTNESICSLLVLTPKEEDAESVGEAYRAINIKHV